jgi:hypothetical protein
MNFLTSLLKRILIKIGLFFFHLTWFLLGLATRLLLVVIGFALIFLAFGYALELQLAAPFATEGVMGSIALFLHHHAVSTCFAITVFVLFCFSVTQSASSGYAHYDDSDDGPNGLRAQAEEHERFHTQIYEMEQTHGSTRND